MKDAHPDDYQRRCIRMAAETAAKMGQTPAQACSYTSTSWQSVAWYDAYAAEKLRLSERMIVPNTFKEPGESDDQWIDRITGAAPAGSGEGKRNG